MAVSTFSPKEILTDALFTFALLMEISALWPLLNKRQHISNNRYIQDG
jgi:hypothetical protein